MEGPEAVQRATELIEQRLAQEEETEVGTEVKGVGEGGLQVKGSVHLCCHGKGKTGCYLGPDSMLFPRAQPGPCPHQDVPNIWHLEGQAFQRPCPLTWASRDRLDCTGKTDEYSLGKPER